jgi:hypothetical protein
MWVLNVYIYDLIYTNCVNLDIHGMHKKVKIYWCWVVAKDKAEGFSLLHSKASEIPDNGEQM